MHLYPLRTNLNDPGSGGPPLRVYTAGTEIQQPMTRLNGFSAKQLFFTLGGSGVFRPLGQHEWDILTEGTMLYIPGQLPHEYRPTGDGPWHVGYVTFQEREPGLCMKLGFGFGGEPRLAALADRQRIPGLLAHIWSCSGESHDRWTAGETLFALMLEIMKQSAEPGPSGQAAGERPPRYRDTVVDRATQFLHDHLQLHFSLEMLASYVGYSPKQVVRLFREVLGTTPLHYMQRLRMQTAAELLGRRSDLSVKEVAAHVGMEPIYFTRQFRRTFGTVPSRFGPRTVEGAAEG